MLQRLSLPNAITFHQQYFPMGEHDDVWLKVVGQWGWVVISQDYSFHLKAPELAAIKQYDVGCFYLWGSEAGRWETMRVFAKAYDKIMGASNTAIRPFVFDVTRRGGLIEKAI